MKRIFSRSQTKFWQQKCFLLLVTWLALSAIVFIPTSAVTSAPLLPETIPAESSPASAQVYLPIVVSNTGQTSADPSTAFPSVEELTALVVNGEAEVVRGAYVKNVLALRVNQQPKDNNNYIYPQSDLLTQYRLAESSNVIGLLAHNTSAGKHFFKIKTGETVSIIYGDGKERRYKVSEIHQYQALQPNSSSSNFLDLETGEILTAGQLFVRMYRGEERVTFQTCITRDGNNTWGRLFVIATPVTK